MYNLIVWKDSVRDPARTYNMKQNPDGTWAVTPAGKVIQEGTNQSAVNFNRIEEGVLDAHIAFNILLQHFLHMEDRNEERLSGLESDTIVEIGTITLSNTERYPFNNSAKTVNLKKVRKTTNYFVEWSIESFTGGIPGEIYVSEKALNGFKLKFDGSAKTVTLKYIVRGGMRS